MPHKDPEARRAWQRKNYQKNKDVINARPCKKKAVDKYREKNKERLRRYGRDYYWDNKETMLSKSKEWRAGGEYEKEHTKNLTDRYCRKQLLKNGYSRRSLSQYPEIVTTYRQLIKIKRLCKTSQNSEKV